MLVHHVYSEALTCCQKLMILQKKLNFTNENDLETTKNIKTQLLKLENSWTPGEWIDNFGNDIPKNIKSLDDQFEKLIDHLIQ
jgi:hypothetical protein